MSRPKIGYSFLRASDGSIVPNGTACYVYERGTETLATLYSQIGEIVPNPTPIISGLVNAYVETGSYDLVVTVDGVSSGPVACEAFLASAIGSSGSGLEVGPELTGEAVLEWGKAYKANASAGSFEIHLPPATGNGGKALYIKITGNSGANTVTLSPHGTERINGEEASLVLAVESSYIRSGTLIAIANNPEVF